MRCEDVTREIAVPTGELDSTDLASHLAICSGCADFRDRSQQLDRLWDATRPADPSPESWQTLWAAVTAAAEPKTIPITASPRWRHRLLTGMALAQAAVLMIAALALFQGMNRSSVASPEQDMAVAGETLIICLDSKGGRVECETRLVTPEQILNSDDINEGAASFSVAWDMEFINSMEGAE